MAPPSNQTPFPARDPNSEPDLDSTYRAFYKRELPAMVALAAAVTGSHVGAEDLAQEALLRAFQRWGTISTYDRPGAWLRRVTINLALKGRRRTTADLRARLRLVSDPTTRAATTGGLAPAPSDQDHIWEAVGRLPGKQRAALALHYLEDRPVAEIAEILDCAENTAKVHLHRGRAALATLLEGASR